jgi:hypothetical protein
MKRRQYPGRFKDCCCQFSPMRPVQGAGMPMWSFGRTWCRSWVKLTLTFQPMFSQFIPAVPNSRGLGLSQLRTRTFWRLGAATATSAKLQREFARLRTKTFWILVRATATARSSDPYWPRVMRQNPAGPVLPPPTTHPQPPDALAVATRPSFWAPLQDGVD